MILDKPAQMWKIRGITRTCGGDPKWHLFDERWRLVLPAHAGVILSYGPPLDKRKSITRTCGGDPNSGLHFGAFLEYYPHMRGWSPLFQQCLLLHLVLPAHAGVIPENIKLFLLVTCITRTCGGDPIYNNKYIYIYMYYPHMRGWSSDHRIAHNFAKVLPAHAGVILRISVCTIIYICITRTCGGDPSTISPSNISTPVLPAHAGVILI